MHNSMITEQREMEMRGDPMGFQTYEMTASTPSIRLMGRMDYEQRPLALDWTGSGMEFRFWGTDAWAKLEAPAASPVMWMIVLADGAPVTRFPDWRTARRSPVSRWNRGSGCIRCCLAWRRSRSGPLP